MGSWPKSRREPAPEGLKRFRVVGTLTVTVIVGVFAENVAHAE